MIRNSDTKLKVYLNFGENFSFVELTNDWHFISIEDRRIGLRHVIVDGSVTVVIMEKQHSINMQKYTASSKELVSFGGID
ncbi:hypothetical protein ACNR9Q_07125 [Maribacter sp. X9]|uniref:hypothetical protein n=1 Tax=Maribacter sp. X9 TaxID=3402159 RepID=UPI003AF38383